MWTSGRWDIGVVNGAVWGEGGRVTYLAIYRPGRESGVYKWVNVVGRRWAIWCRRSWSFALSSHRLDRCRTYGGEVKRSQKTTSSAGVPVGRPQAALIKDCLIG